MNILREHPHFVRIFNTACYAIVAAAPAAATLLLTPILVRTLGYDGFAHWTLLEPLIALGAAALTCGAQYGILQRTAANAEARFPAAAFLIMALSAPVVWLLTGFVVAPKYGWYLFVAICAAQLGDAVVAFASNYYRGKLQPLKMAILEGGRQGGIIVVSVILAFGLHALNEVATVSLVRAGSTAVAIVLLFLPLVRMQGPMKLNEASGLVRYGAPIFVSQLLNILVMNADRYVAALVHTPPEDLTSYIAHLRLASALNLLVVAPLSLWFPPIALKADPAKDANTFRTIGKYVTLGLMVAVVASNVFGLLLWSKIFPDIKFDPLLLNTLVAGVAFQCFAVLWNVGALRPGSTVFNMLPTIIALGTMSIVGVALGLVTGTIGVAFARLFALALSAVVFERVSTHITGRSTASLKQVGTLAVMIALTTLITVGSQRILH